MRLAEFGDAFGNRARRFFLLDLFADEVPEEQFGRLVLFGLRQRDELVDHFRYLAFVGVNGLEYVGQVLPRVRRVFGLAQHNGAAAFHQIGGHLVGVFVFFFGLFAEPVGKAVQTVFLAVKRHGRVKAGRPKFSGNLLIDRFFKFL